jgi:hypothetical protein
VPDWLIAVLPLAGVALGASLQYFLGGAQARSARRLDVTLEVYADYLQALTMAGTHPRGAQTEEAFQARVALLNAKDKMTVYASEPVVRAAAALHRDWYAEEGFMDRLVDLAEAMRDDTRGKADKASRKDLDELLWGATRRGVAPVLQRDPASPDTPTDG